MRKFGLASASMVIAAGLAGCAETPAGPHVQVLPAQNKPFEVFMQDQTLCKQYAADQVGGQAQAANEKGIIEALIGAALGAGIGGATGGGHGAGVGAAVGGAAGTVVGGSSSSQSGLSIQQQYDNAYSQCMYAKGNQIVAQPATVHVVHPAYYYPPPPPPPVVYTAPPVVYSQQPPAPAAPAQGYAVPQQGYAAPSGAAVPPPGTAAPAQ